VINWKLACVPLLSEIKGHQEPRVFVFKRRDTNDAKSPCVMRAKLHMAAIKNEAYFPKQGWVIWESDERPTVDKMTFLPKKKIDVAGLTIALDYLTIKKYIPKDQLKVVQVFIKAKGEQNEDTCDTCMGFRAVQLTHKSSKNHTDIERKEHRSVRDKTTIAFNKHLFADRKAHDMPTLKQCWPVGVTIAVNRDMQSADVDDTDSDTGAAELKDGELYVDQIGKEVMTVGRVQYSQLKPLKIGNMVVLYTKKPGSQECFYVARVMAWKNDGGKKKLNVHWYGHMDNKDKAAADRLYFRGERKKNSSEQGLWVRPTHRLANNREWVEDQPQDSLLYWVEDTFLNVTGIINFYALRKILARVEWVKNNLGDN
jgi:hypothetical protein